jgi:hypothetical protein
LSLFFFIALTRRIGIALSKIEASERTETTYKPPATFVAPAKPEDIENHSAPQTKQPQSHLQYDPYESILLNNSSTPQTATPTIIVTPSTYSSTVRRGSATRVIPVEAVAEREPKYEQPASILDKEEGPSATDTNHDTHIITTISGTVADVDVAIPKSNGNSDSKPLKDLTIAETAVLIRSLEFPSAISDAIISHGFNGRILAVIKSPEQLTAFLALENSVPLIIMEAVFDAAQDFKSHDVPFRLLRSVQ